MTVERERETSKRTKIEICIKCQQSANMIGSNAEIEKKSEEISAQDIDVISTPKIITFEGIPVLRIHNFS